MKKSELCHVYFIYSRQQIYTSALETGIFTFQLFKTNKQLKYMKS